MDAEPNDRVHRLEAAVFGNGRPGLDERMATVERTMFLNPKTGEPGLVADMRDVKRFMAHLVTESETRSRILRSAWSIITALVGMGVLGVLAKLFMPSA